MRRIAIMGISVLLVAALCIPTTAAYAVEPTENTPPFTRSETVYVNLAANGSTNGIYMVNNFESAKSQTITDFGNYEKVVNLTTSEELAVEQDTVTFEMEEGTFLFQGNKSVNTPLPWSIAISYRLDGKSISPAELSGSAGKLEISIKVTPNTSDEQLQAYVENYLMQISGDFSFDVASSIVAEGATLADAGSAKAVNYMVLPGEAKEFTIRADVTDFHFDGFQIAAVPLALAIDLDEADTSALTENMAELQEAIATLDSGTGELAGGSAELQTGIDTLASEGTRLSDGSALIAGGIAGMNSELGRLSYGSNLYYNGINLGMQNIEGQVGGVPNLTAGEQGLQYMLDQQTQLATGSVMGLESIINDLPSLTSTMTKDDAVIAVQALLNTYKATYVDNLSVANAGVNGSQDYVRAASIYETLAGLRDNYAPINNGIAAAVNGVAYFGSEYSTFNDGVHTYTSGVQTLASNYGTFHAGLEQLSHGTQLLHEGTVNLDKELLNGIKDQFSSFLGGGDAPQSFADPRNNNVSQVQFIFMVDGVAAPEKPVEEVDDTDENENPFTRLLALFGG